MRKPPSQYDGAFRMFVVFFVGATFGVGISNMRQMSITSDVLPTDSPEFTGWKHPFVHIGAEFKLSKI
jgi:hypothetical protein